jgi:hypothetical protein
MRTSHDDVSYSEMRRDFALNTIRAREHRTELRNDVLHERRFRLEPHC